MRDLGGPTPKENILKIHTRRLNSVLDRTVWYFTICPEPGGAPVGTIGLWDSDFDCAKIKEMGWMVLPAFQGRGLATAAGQMTLARARTEGRAREIHAFTSALNGASNAICKKLGFILLGEVELAYNGPPQPSNHWKIDLCL